MNKPHETILIIIQRHSRDENSYLKSCIKSYFIFSQILHVLHSDLKLMIIFETTIFRMILPDQVRLENIIFQDLAA